MAEKAKILIVDDDNNIAELIALYLTKECYDTRIVGDGEEAVKQFAEYEPNLVLLDLMLPGIDGYEVCRQIRKTSDTPIIMLSAKGEIFDKVLGLELGADDYMMKPFDSKELVARVKAVLRRMRQDNPPTENLHEAHPVSTDNQVFTREQLLDRIWGYEYVGDTRTVDVHIKRLREKLHDHEEWRLGTVWGIGYKFELRNEL